MGFQADIQILVCLHSFQAINAKYTHPYCMAIKISTVLDGQTVEAFPHAVISHPDSLLLGSIDSRINCYMSPYFKLSPQNISVNLRQLCCFKLSVPWTQKTDNSQLVVEIFLYVLNGSMALANVGSQGFRLRKLTGRSTFLPIFFEGFHYTCSVDASIHTQLLGFRWRQVDQVGSEEEHPRRKTLGEFIKQNTSMSRVVLDQLYLYYSQLLEAGVLNLKRDIRSLSGSDTCDFQHDEGTLANLHDLKGQDQNQWGAQFMANLHALSGYSHQLWNQYIRYRMEFPDAVAIKQSFFDQLKYEYRQHIYCNLEGGANTQQLIDKAVANTTLVVRDLKFPRSVKIFIQTGDFGCVQPLESSQEAGEHPDEHVVVLVHGLAANRLAMESLKNILLYNFPDLRVLVSGSNQNRTDEHIEQMGRRLAEEVRHYIAHCRLVKYKLTFVAHSLGGLITRAALMHLETFKSHLHNFITLGTPHVGYLFHHSYIIKAGMWFLNRFKQTLSLSMLNFTDKQNISQSYLYRLSMQSGFDWFDHVVLVANPGDSYVSQHSALVQFCPAAIESKQEQDQTGTIYCQIVDNLQGQFKMTKVTRVTVHGLACTKRGMDSMIGRTAHIEYLSDSTFLQMFVLSHQSLFRV